ncbi:unnamed protein product, partial [Mesorhabditis belari]|uniref:ShKT domain-containing protein n=1 Tax=Mesorhabditis belari TaxID=2138241 RepID=A0AAF3JAP2_9BILA
MRIGLAIFVYVGTVIADHTTKPPCCRDHLSATTCQRLLRSSPRYFADRCNLDAEFRLVQCCTTCNKSGMAMSYDLIARSLVSAQCFDRHEPTFCARYVNHTEPYVQPAKPWTCDGENPQIAFRLCRQSCGFCDFKIVHYTLENAVKACKSTKLTWRQRWGPRMRENGQKIG